MLVEFVNEQGESLGVLNNPVYIPKTGEQIKFIDKDDDTEFVGTVERVTYEITQVDSLQRRELLRIEVG